MSHFYRQGKRVYTDNAEVKAIAKRIRKERKEEGRDGKGVTEEAREEYGAVPGVTDFLKFVGDSGGLIQWAMNQGVKGAIEAIGVVDGIEGVDRDNIWTKDSKARGRELMSEAASRGTVIHDGIDKYLSTGEEPEDAIARNAALEVEGFLKALGVDGEKEFCFSTDEYGGTIDFLDKDRMMILDWKSVASDRAPRMTELAQLCAYTRATFGHETVKMGNIYISQHTGEIVLKRWWNEQEQIDGYSLFRHAVGVYNLMRRFK